MLLIAVFLAVLFCPHVLWKTFGKQLGEESEENRIKAQKPAFSLEGIASYPKAYEEYYNDHLPFRNLLIKLYNSMLYHAFGTSGSKDVIIGKDNWLFYSNDIDGSPLQCYNGSLILTNEELETIADNLTKVQNTMEERGGEFVLFIAPNKGRIYSEFMPSYMGVPAEDCMVNQVISYLREYTDIRIVYPYDELMRQKEKNPDRLLYYKTDTHWNAFGGYIGARELLFELGIEYPTLDQMDTSVVYTGTGDLAQMMNLSNSFGKEYSGTIHGYHFNEASAIEDDFYGTIEYHMNQAFEKRLFVRRDSFCTAMLPYLSSSFFESRFVHHNSFSSEQMLEYQPDIFVLETVERYLPLLINPIVQ